MGIAQILAGFTDAWPLLFEEPSGAGSRAAKLDQSLLRGSGRAPRVLGEARPGSPKGSTQAQVRASFARPRRRNHI